MSQYIRYPNLSGILKVPTAADLPVTASDGALALTLDTDTLYAFNAMSMTWVTLSGPTAVLMIGTLDGQPPSANGASIALNSLYLQSASATFPGLVNLTTQSFAGNKTFTGTISASNLSGTNTGNVTIGTANGLSLAGQALSLQLSDTTHTGALSNTDWNTFNNKQPALGFTPENTANKGVAGGYAPLDGAAKVPYTNLPSALMTYKGAWDASTNTPTLADGIGLIGDTYRTSVAGTQNLGSGPQTFFVGDFVIYNGTIWQRSPAADGVTSVNGFTGAVSLTTTNIPEGTNLYYTDARVRLALSATSPLQYNNSTGVFSIQLADSTHDGYLSSVDWNTFNNKQPAGSYITALTGDVTATGPGSVTATLGITSSKGDLIVNNGTINVAEPVGTDTYVLTADSAQSTGIKWAPAAATINTVVASYYMSAITAVTADTQINYDTLIIDTNSAVTTGASWKFTAPFTGYYQVSSIGLSNTSGWNVRIWINGVAYSYLTGIASTATTSSGSIVVSLSSGDYIDIRPDVTVTFAGEVNSSHANLISISKVN